jgi:methyl-accepting chemotaxis protein
MRISATNVTHSIESIAAVSEENSAAAEEVAAATHEMTDQVNILTNDAASLASAAEELAEVVARFDLETAMVAAGMEPPARDAGPVPVGGRGSRTAAKAPGRIRAA